jgi:hypothetical protein
VPITCIIDWNLLVGFFFFSNYPCSSHKKAFLPLKRLHGYLNRLHNNHIHIVFLHNDRLPFANPTRGSEMSHTYIDNSFVMYYPKYGYSFFTRPILSPLSKEKNECNTNATITTLTRWLFFFCFFSKIRNLLRYIPIQCIITQQKGVYT